MSKKIKVVNAVWNGSNMIRLKDAEHYIKEKRAEWVVTDQQLRLILSHPKNQAAAGRAARWALEQTSPCPNRILRNSSKGIAQNLRLYGTRPLDRHRRPCGLEASDSPSLTVRPAPKREKPWWRVWRDAHVIGYDMSQVVIWVRPYAHVFGRGRNRKHVYEARVFDRDGHLIEETQIAFWGRENFGRTIKVGIRGSAEAEVTDGLLYPISEAERMVTAEARRQQFRRLLDEKAGSVMKSNEDEDCNE